MIKRLFKNIFALAAISAAAVLFSACSSNSGAEASASVKSDTAEKASSAAETAGVSEGRDRLDEIKERGYLIVGTEGTWSPYTFHDKDDNLVGFDVELARIIADHIGVDVKYSETVWSSIFASFDSGQIDTVINEVSYSDERAEKYDFSVPYTFTRHAVLVRSDNTDINSLEDLKGKVAANNPTSATGQLAVEYGAELDTVEEMAQSISEVINGRADCTLNTVVAFADYMKTHPEAGEKVKIITVTDPEPYGYIPVQKGNEKLLNAINEAIEAANEDGTLSGLSMKYFDIDITKQ